MVQSARVVSERFSTNERLKDAGILYVFQVFQPAQLRQKIRRQPQTIDSAVTYGGIRMFFFFTNPILIAAAIIPAIFLLVHVYRADKLEKEPAPLLISLVLYGIAATFIALVLERLGSWILGQYFEENSTIYNAIMYFGVVAFSEEGAKYFLLRRRTWNSAAFNCQFDGVVYAAFVSLGFALWENISYVLMYGFTTAIVRALTAVPGHACFGVFMGVWYGLAKRLHGQGRDGASKLCRVLALLLPAFLHGCYDFIASIESVHYGWLFAAFVGVMFLLAFILVKRQAKHDRYINNYDAEYL